MEPPHRPPDSDAPPPPEPGTPLYVHLPFCVVKCTYCDFYSVVAEGQDLPGTLAALEAEVRARGPRAPRTVFLGGGTPSLYGPAELARFLDALDDATGFRSSAVEVTAECNPESLDAETARALLSGGVNRLTIGLQSLDPGTLELFGRAHSAEQGLIAFATAREAGCERLGVDVIWGAPGQTLAGWEHELGRVLELRPDHLSAYGLMYEQGTTMTRWREEGRISPLEEELELDLLCATRRLASEAGMEAYEVSNFSQSGHECLHNVNYWRNGPYVGVGPSAVSKVGQVRFGNPRSLTAWHRTVQARSWTPAWTETPDPIVRLAETWWLGLRLSEGVDPAAARETAGFSGPDRCEALAAELAVDGWLERGGRGWRMTDSALPLADAVAGRFLALVTAAPADRATVSQER